MGAPVMEPRTVEEAIAAGWRRIPGDGVIPDQEEWDKMKEELRRQIRKRFQRWRNWKATTKTTLVFAAVFLLVGANAYRKWSR